MLIASITLLLAPSLFQAPQQEAGEAVDPTRWRIRLGEHLPALQGSEAAVQALIPIIDRGTRAIREAGERYNAQRSEAALAAWFGAASTGIADLAQAVRGVQAQRAESERVVAQARSDVQSDLERARSTVKELERRLQDRRARLADHQADADQVREAIRATADGGREPGRDELQRARKSRRTVIEAAHAAALEEGRLANQVLAIEALERTERMLDSAEEKLWNLHTQSELFGAELEIQAERLALLMDIRETREAWSVLGRIGSQVRQMSLEQRGLSTALDALARESGREASSFPDPSLGAWASFEAWLTDEPLYGERVPVTSPVEAEPPSARQPEPPAESLTASERRGS